MFKFHLRNITCPQVSGQKVYIFQISRRYDIKPVAHQIRPLENLFFCDVYVTDINYGNLERRLMVASNLKNFIGYRIFQSDIVSQNLATISLLLIYLKKKVFFDALKKQVEGHILFMWKG